LHRRHALAAAVALVVGLSGLTASADPVNPVDGPFPQAHGETVTDLPSTPTCTTTIVKDARFKNSAYGPDGAWSGSYAPTCSGPWSKVVVTMSADVEPGTQFDRIGELQLGGAELLHFTTPEGTSGRTTWSIQRDVTSYSSLFDRAQPVWFQIGNVTDGTYTGIFYGTVSLTFWSTSAASPAAASPDLVVPLSAVAPSARNLPYITEPTQRLEKAVTLPHNLNSLTAEVFTSGHGPCEEDWWYEPFACSGQPYREVAVYVDGRLAGVAPVFPALFTGGWGPDWWRPVPGPRTLNLRPYTVDLTPFVGQLTDDLPHTFGVGILGWQVKADGDYWPTATNLLATVNHADSGRTRGAVTAYQGSAEPTISLTGEPSLVGGRYVASHHLTVTGWTQRPGERPVTTKVEEQIDATLVQIAAAVKSDWHWVSTSSTGASTDATYQLIRDGARFAFVDKARTAVGSRWVETDDRMQTSGPTLVSGIIGNSQESWVWSDSLGRCVDHELIASTQNVLVDNASTSCPPATLPVV
jgi:hypothetical protein